MLVPVLPESAPFTPAQRAWLNGFFAGLLGFETEGQAATAATTSTATSITVAVEEEEYPWHDPALPLEERMELAEGKPVERRLMAAMAQLDCGACGYLCKTYSEAIARGEEKDLRRCTPGGAPTAKKIKELLASRPPGEALTTSGTPMASVVSGPGTPSTTSGVSMSSVVARANGSTYDRANPFPAKLIECRPLNGPGARKDTRLVRIGLAGSGLTYRPGDSLGIYPENCPALVDEVMAALGAVGEASDLRETLIREVALGRPPAELIELLAACAADPSAARELDRLRGADEDEWLDAADILDLLGRFPTARPAAQEFVRTLARLQPRLYSISSSLRAHPDEVHLTVGVVRYTQGGRPRKGVASTFLADRLAQGGTVRVFVQPSHRFRLPDDGETPIIMIGPGTGIAPFRAFLEERRESGASGKNWLFFGDQCRATDFLYEDELLSFQRSGILTRLDTAFSRDQAEKVYVQHRMLARAGELWGWLEEGAHVYVCGDAKRMASDVDRALREVVADRAGLSPDEAKAYVAEMARAGRYQRDVY